MNLRATTVGAANALAALDTEMRAACAAQTQGGELRALAGARVYLKYGSLRGHARRRHGWRARVGLRLPRLAEYANLEWLRAHDFDAVEPIAAGAYWERGLPHFQFLATRAVEDAETLRARLERDAPTEARALLAARLGGEVARLHRAGFVHRDLFPRNLLVTANDERIVFLDAWRGGPGLALPGRGPSYDLACLLVHGVELFATAELDALLDAYFAGRAIEGRRRGAFLSRVGRQRARLVDHLARKGRTTPPLPRHEWP